MVSPLNGLVETTVKGRPAVVEYEPDPELRDTEQIPLLHDGGIDVFMEKEVLPYASRRLVPAGTGEGRDTRSASPGTSTSQSQ